MICIYGLKCPVAGVIRYVGKSSRPAIRWRAHVRAARNGDYNHHTARWIRKLVSSGLVPELIILHEIVDGERWQDVERAFIASAQERGWRLTNSTAGGEGLDYIDPQAKANYIRNLSGAMKKLWNRPERKEEARRRSFKAWADPEVTARRMASRSVAVSSPEAKAKHCAAMALVNARPNVKAVKSMKAKLQWANPEIRQRMVSAINRDKLSMSAKARWSDPVKGPAAHAMSRTPEKRAKLSAAARRRSTPAYRTMMAEKTRLAWKKRRVAA